MDLIIGVDAGATATKLALMGPDGRLLATGEAPMMLPCFVDFEGFEAALRMASVELMSNTGFTARDLLGAVLGISGCDRPQERGEVKRRVKRALGPNPVRVHVAHDALVALVGGCGKPEGIVVIAGTGSIAFGQNAGGETARAGGGGALLSDEGSGYDLGRRALVAAFRAADGRGPKTALLDSVLQRLELPDAPALIPWSRGPGQEKAAVAALAPLVFEAARQGDELADTLVIHAAAELALGAHSVAQRLWDPDEPVEVAMAGRLFAEQPILRRRFIALLEAMQPSLAPISPRASAAEGACSYGLHLWRGAAKVPAD